MVGKRVKPQRVEAERPIEAVEASARPAQPRRIFAREVPALDLSGVSLFVVNDNEFLRTYMERLFGIMRVGRVVTCSDPDEARDLLATAEPDIVMLDLDLYGEDGISLVHQIRHGELGLRKDVAILVASAFVDRDYVRKARNNGINWTLVKPLTFRRLYEGLARVILDERPFVDTPGYVGPDRRLLVGISGYDGFERRKGGRKDDGE